MPEKKWIVKENIDDKKPLIERLLSLRGIVKPDEIKAFLNPLEMELSSPFIFSDMERAVERVSKAIDNAENILIYGDFDADGITSTSLLYRTFKYLGAEIDYFIPNRETDGHGMNNKRLVSLMAAKKPKLIITVDCGISNIDEIKFLSSFKIDVIVTDHHEAGKTLPNAHSIINPKAPNSLVETLSVKQIQEMTSLAGVGVAFKLAHALLLHYEKTEFILEILPYVAVGTVADVVPLVGENRYFVQKGLQLIASGKHYGLKRLLESAEYNLENGLTAEMIAFGIAPRINASGRLDSVEDSMNLFISDNKQQIEISINSLNDYNRIRQELCHQTFLEACDMYEAEKNKTNSIILFNKDWHIGIIGIVASKIVEKYYKPTFLMTYSEETKQYRCSARGVSQLNLYEIISANSSDLDGFGGHAMAAGLSFSEDKISFKTVKEQLSKTVEEFLVDEELIPVVDIDLEISPHEVSVALVDEISTLEPFGASNPSPIFAMHNVVVKENRLIGQNKEHVRLVVEKDGCTFTCLWWSRGEIPLTQGDRIDIAFSMQNNEFNGNTSVQFVLIDVHSEVLRALDRPQNKIKMYNHTKRPDSYAIMEDYVKNSQSDVVIFAEQKFVLENLKPYKSLSSNIISRNTLRAADVLIFFDYPPCQEDMDRIIAKVSPNSIHYMALDLEKIDEKDILKQCSGMIRFVCNKKDGKFDMLAASSFLALPAKAIEVMLNLFESSSFVKITDREDDNFILSIESGNVDMTKVAYMNEYSDFVDEINFAQQYRADLLEKMR